MSRGDWVQSFTGRKIFPLDLRPEDVAIEDVAHALACQARFSGHTKRGPYSVAQHSVLVSLNADPADALWGLLHDASEYVLQDIPRPLKHTPAFAFYREAEARAMAAICEAFGLPLAMPASVEVADQRILATEARDLMAPLHPEWTMRAEPYPQPIRPWAWGYAEAMFLDRFYALTKEAA